VCLVIDHLCNFLITIERARITKDLVGGAKREIWEPVVQNLQAAIQPLNSGIKQQFGQRQMVNTHRLYFSTEPPIRRGDRIKAYNPNRMFVVTGVLDQGGRRRVFSVDVREQME
jgi:head-tail adaptor